MRERSRDRRRQAPRDRRAGASSSSRGAARRRALELIASLEPDSVLLAGPRDVVAPRGPARRAERRRGSCRCPSSATDPLGDLEPLLLLLTRGRRASACSPAARHTLLERRIEAARRPSPDRARGRRAGGRLRSQPARQPNSSWSGCHALGRSSWSCSRAFPTARPQRPLARSRLRPPGAWAARRRRGRPTTAGSSPTARRSAEVPVKPSRPNLWKLLLAAEVCLDLRPQGIVARETIESLLLGTPVVVPEGTVAAEHAERSNGGLWYRDYPSCSPPPGRSSTSAALARGALAPGARVGRTACTATRASSSNRWRAWPSPEPRPGS